MSTSDLLNHDTLRRTRGFTHAHKCISPPHHHVHTCANTGAHTWGGGGGIVLRTGEDGECSRGGISHRLQGIVLEIRAAFLWGCRAAWQWHPPHPQVLRGARYHRLCMSMGHVVGPGPTGRTAMDSGFVSGGLAARGTEPRYFQRLSSLLNHL